MSQVSNVVVVVSVVVVLIAVVLVVVTCMCVMRYSVEIIESCASSPAIFYDILSPHIISCFVRYFEYV